MKSNRGIERLFRRRAPITRKLSRTVAPVAVVILPKAFDKPVHRKSESVNKRFSSSIKNIRGRWSIEVNREANVETVLLLCPG
jgi:hypothetical protein